LSLRAEPALLYVVVMTKAKTSSKTLTDVLLGVVVGLTVSGGTLPAAEPKVPKPPTLLGLQEARSATELVNLLGVVVHMTYNQTPYANAEKVQQALDYTGIRTVRDATPLADTRTYDSLASHGVKFDFVLRAEAAAELPATVRRLEAFAQRHPGAIVAIEGMNEVNNWPAKYKGLQGLPAAIAVQRDLYAAVKSSPTLKGVPVYALTLGAAGVADYAKLGDLSDIADTGNAHIYFPKGAPPSTIWSHAYELARHPTQRLPKAVVTETGYTTSKGSPHGVDEQVQAKYLLTLVAEAWLNRVPRVYIYQLVNDSLDETNWTRGLGLYRFDWTAKPAANAFHNLTGALLSGGASAAGTGQEPALDFDVKATKENVNNLPVRKADGTLDLIFWREQPLWDGDARKEIPATTAQVSFTLGSGYSHVAVFDPLDGKRTQISPRNGRFDFDLPDHPVVIEARE
jgi:hypothetical protein